MHLLAEEAGWRTRSEFVDANGKRSVATGETRIRIHQTEIINQSWVAFDEVKLSNDYRIQKVTDFLYRFESSNPALGQQKGTFRVDRNILYSNFEIEKTELTGFEVIIRHRERCEAYGALYRNEELVNTWVAMMEKKI